jgi:hypothetical protein
VVQVCFPFLCFGREKNAKKAALVVLVVVEAQLFGPACNGLRAGALTKLGQCLRRGQRTVQTATCSTNNAPRKIP